MDMIPKFYFPKYRIIMLIKIDRIVCVYLYIYIYILTWGQGINTIYKTPG